MIQAEHTGILMKNHILIGFYIFMHRHLAPKFPELGVYTYCHLLIGDRKSNLCSTQNVVLQAPSPKPATGPEGCLGGQQEL